MIFRHHQTHWCFTVKSLHVFFSSTQVPIHTLNPIYSFFFFYVLVEKMAQMYLYLGCTF